MQNEGRILLGAPAPILLSAHPTPSAQVTCPLVMVPTRSLPLKGAFLDFHSFAYRDRMSHVLFYLVLFFLL
jgi:hypothetical protein